MEYWYLIVEERHLLDLRTFTGNKAGFQGLVTDWIFNGLLCERTGTHQTHVGYGQWSPYTDKSEGCDTEGTGLESIDVL